LSRFRNRLIRDLQYLEQSREGRLSPRKNRSHSAVTFWSRKCEFQRREFVSAYVGDATEGLSDTAGKVTPFGSYALGQRLSCCAHSDRLRPTPIEWPAGPLRLHG
jgi:hypothetical protein